MNKYYCLIPARGGSKGLVGKNIKCLAGKPLIAHSISCAEDSNIFEKIYISTDYVEIADVAIKYGADIPYIRDSKLGQDDTHMFKVYKEFVDRVKEIDEQGILIVLLPTNPLRTKEDIYLVKNEYENNSDIEWVFTCNEAEHHPFRSVRIDSESNELQPFFPIENTTMWSNRQELPKAYRFNGAVISGKISSIKQNNEYPIDSYRFMNTTVKGVISSKNSKLDIDTIQDFEYIEYLLNK